MTALPRLLLFLGLATGLLAAEPILTVKTADKTLTFTAEEFAALPHIECAATDPHTQAARKFSGVAVSEILVRAGAPLGKDLRGPALRFAVLARAQDGYSVVFALADFDEAFSSRTILLADTEDGKPLAAGSGPLRIIAPGDKKGARWARLVNSLEVIPVGPAADRPAHH